MSAESSWESTVARSGHWGEEEGRAALSAWRASGLSLPAFAKRHGLTTERLRRWRARLSAPPASVGFAAVTVRPSAEAVVGEAAVRVRVGAASVEVVDADRVAASWVASLVRALS